MEHALHRWLLLLPVAISQHHRLQREYAVLCFRPGGSEDWNIFLAAAVGNDWIYECLRLILVEVFDDFHHLICGRWRQVLQIDQNFLRVEAGGLIKVSFRAGSSKLTNLDHSLDGLMANYLALGSNVLSVFVHEIQRFFGIASWNAKGMPFLCGGFLLLLRPEVWLIGSYGRRLHSIIRSFCGIVLQLGVSLGNWLI